MNASRCLKKYGFLVFLWSIALLVFVGCAVEEYPEPDPMSAGSAENGLYADEDDVTTRLLPEPELLWRKSIGGNHTGYPALGGDHVVVTSWDGAIRALDRQSGDLRWEFQTKAPIDCTGALIHQQRVYVTSDAFRCLELSTGRELWSYSDGSYMVSFPAASDDGLVAATSLTPAVFACDSLEGSVLWRISYPPGMYLSSPVMVDQSLYLMTSNGGIVRHDARTGQLMWHYESGYEGDIVIPAVVDGILTGIIGNRCLTLETTSGELLWERTLPASYGHPPVLIEGAVYLFSEQLEALDALSGELLWTLDLKGAHLSASRFYLFGGNATSIFAIYRSNGKVLWQQEIPRPLYGPIIHQHGVLFFGSLGGSSGSIISSIDTGLPTLHPWPLFRRNEGNSGGFAGKEGWGTNE